MKTPLEKLRSKMVPIADELDRQLEDAAGERITFGLFVWNREGWSFLSNGADNKQINAVLEDMVADVIADPPQVVSDRVH